MLDKYLFNEEFYYLNEENCRYLLGTVGKNPLICIGLSPSSAIPAKFDNTFNRLKDIAKYNDFDSIIVFNLYPFKEGSNSKHSSLVTIQEEKNLEIIKDVVQELSSKIDLKILLCWGNNIETYENYKYDRKKLCKILENFSKNIYCLKRTIKNHPISPVFINTNTTLQNFEDNFKSYLND